MKALVLSGGGARGAYQAGVLYQLAQQGKLNYDVLCGISVGALNCSFLAQYHNFQRGTSDLMEMWLACDDRKVFKKWFLWPLSILWKPSVYNSKPLQDMVENYVEPMDFVKKLIVGAVSLTDGDYQTWSEKDPDILNGILASSAFPGMLTPIETRGKLWTDGGLRRVTPIKDAIMAGATSIDVVMTSPKNSVAKLTGKPNAIKVGVHSMGILLDESIEKDLKLAHLYNKLANLDATDKRYLDIRVMRPPRPLGDSLSFSPKKIREEIELGIEDSKEGGLLPLWSVI